VSGFFPHRDEREMTSSADALYVKVLSDFTADWNAFAEGFHDDVAEMDTADLLASAVRLLARSFAVAIDERLLLLEAARVQESRPLSSSSRKETEV
jgi:hypothetical protein